MISELNPIKLPIDRIAYAESPLINLHSIRNPIGDWGLGIGDLGIGPNPQSPIPNPQSPYLLPYINFKKFIGFLLDLLD